MADEAVPQPGERCKVKTEDGEETAVWTGFMWFAPEGGRILEADAIESWEAAPHEDELTIHYQNDER